MKSEQDILKSASELRNMPYTIPEGYFRRLENDVMSGIRESRERPRPVFARLAPYAAMAAVFVFLVTAGSFLLERTTPRLQEEYDEFYFYTNLIPATDPYAIASVEEDPDEVLDEDIIEYLIYTGTTAEVIELSK